MQQTIGNDPTFGIKVGLNQLCFKLFDNKKRVTVKNETIFSATNYCTPLTNRGLSEVVHELNKFSNT